MNRKIPTPKAYKYAFLTLLFSLLFVSLLCFAFFTDYIETVEQARYEHDLFAVFMNQPERTLFLDQPIAKLSGRALQSVFKDGRPERVGLAFNNLAKLEAKIVAGSEDHPPSNSRPQLAGDLLAVINISRGEQENPLSNLEFSDSFLTLNNNIEGKVDLSHQSVLIGLASFFRANTDSFESADQLAVAATMMASDSFLRRLIRGEDFSKKLVNAAEGNYSFPSPDELWLGHSLDFWSLRRALIVIIIAQMLAFLLYLVFYYENSDNKYDYGHFYNLNYRNPFVWPIVFLFAVPATVSFFLWLGLVAVKSTVDWRKKTKSEKIATRKSLKPEAILERSRSQIDNLEKMIT